MVIYVDIGDKMIFKPAYFLAYQIGRLIVILIEETLN